MLTLTLEDIIILVALWMGCGLVSALVFIRFAVLHWGGEAVMNAILEPKPKTLKAIGALMMMLLESQIPTGKKVTVDGKEQDEYKPLLIFMGGALYRQMELQARAKMGGNRSGAEAAANADPMLSAMSGSILSGKGKNESTLDWIARTALSTPQAQSAISRIVENSLGKLLPK